MAYAEKRGKGEYPWRVKFKKPDGTEDQKSGFRTRTDALNYGREQEADARRGNWRDPGRGALTLDEYWARWYPLQLSNWGDGTQYHKRGMYRNHLQPRWGATPLDEIDPIEAREFEQELRGRRSKSTADDVVLLLRQMMADAVLDRRLDFTPVPPVSRRGKRVPDETREGIVTSLEKVEAICARMPPDHAMLVLVTLFTGMRWGEATAMRRSFLELTPASKGSPARGHYTIDPKVGAVHVHSKRAFGTTKSYTGRVIELPPFLVLLLTAYLETLPEGRDLLFATRTGRPLSAANFNRRHWRPACDGRPEVAGGRRTLEKWEPVEFGLWFHDLRRTHKTWLAEDGIEPVARDERLGHATQGMDGVYVKPTPAMRVKILNRLQRRWDRAHPPGSGSPKSLPS